MPRVSSAAAVFAAAVLLSAPSLADPAVCLNGKGQARVRACDAEIRAGKTRGPALVALHVARGEGLIELRKYKDAIAAFDTALRLAPNEAAALSGRGWAEAMSWHFERGRADLDRALALKADDAVALARRGYVWTMISDSPNPKLEAEALAKADADLRAALARAPNLALAHRGLAYVATLKKNWPAALAAADKAVALEPDGSAGYCRRGRVHGEAKEYAKALADIAEGLKRDANDADCYFHRAYAVWDLQERWADSVADYSKAIALDPDDYYSLNNRAWAYMKMGQSPKGLPDAQKAIQLAPRWAEARDTAGHILEAMGKKAEAIAEYRQALALDPKHQGAKDGLARLGAKP